MRRRIDTDNLVGIGEIAELTGSSTQAVANWQQRHSDFPVPIRRLKCGPIFDWKEVQAWLVATGRQ